MMYMPLAVAALAGLAAAAPVVPRQSCVSGLYIIVARGSEEPAGEGKTSQVADMIVSAVPGSTSVAVDYPASVFGDGTYPTSVKDGINDAKAKIQDYVDACGATSQIVLLGFSQGGNVMTDVLAGGVAKPDPITSDYSQYITAVAVFGDPTFTPGQSFDQGTSTTGGIFEREEGGDSLALLNTYADIIQSYCDDGDLYCASGSDSSVHGQEVPSHAQAATDFVASLAGY
ncbi:carbohydrate esterase family 5 protein [Polychaeton citri CBS 116435]|uniref:Carbohydrate esterase family 5 protein n=1 Tax=Polychaeton citri CBS 116435 TaxID=1314669 RepID=A0A9P4UUC6_9PEZI|nr:carbohydrate esterase family 5 protein [Polychaeton citri CBS 116435]